MKAASALLMAAAALGVASSSGPGLECLDSPQNVTIHVVNTNITLKWDWDNPCDLDVAFSAQYQQVLEDEAAVRRWIVISECQNVTVTECYLSSSILHYFDFYDVRLRVETRGKSSQWAGLHFSPFIIAQIGPPGVQLESVDGNMKILILHPEEKQTKKMWKLTTLAYNLTIWKNTTNAKETTQKVCSGQTLHKLEPETTYCLKVKASSPGHQGLYSPIYCLKTPKGGLPSPTNLTASALNMKCLLDWDNLSDTNVTFTVQYLRAYKKCSSPDYSKDWLTVSGCENIATMQCDFSSSVHFTGIYYLRVRSMNSHNKSPWSEEFEFIPKNLNEIGPPSLKINVSDSYLRIFLISPGVFENKSMSDLYELSYRILYWKNSSDVKVLKTAESPSPSFTISDLAPSTLYCLKAQAFCRTFDKNSTFSDVECFETTHGESSSSSILINFLIAIGAIISVACLIYAVYYICGGVRYIFCPTLTPPLTLENVGGKLLSSPCLLTSEETTEDCSIITENSISEKIIQIDIQDSERLEQIRQDLGNYSHLDNLSGNKETHDTSEREAI